MTTRSSTTKEALEPCPLAHPIVNGVRFTNFSNNVKAHIWCYDCGLEFEGRVNEPRDKVAERWNSRVSAPIVAPEVGDADDSEAESLSVTLPQLETRFQTATSHDEVVTLVWACRALLDEDTECAPFFTPEAQDRQMVHAAILRLYFEHAARVLGRQPHPAEVDEIETGFCTPRGQKDVIAKLDRGRRLLAAIQRESTTPASTVAPQQSVAARCPDCGARLTSDFDEDVGMWEECTECDYRNMLSSRAPASPAALRDEADELVDEVQHRMDQVVEAAVEWHQAGREGTEWFEAAEKLGAAIDSLLELRGDPNNMPRRWCLVHDREEFKYESLEHELHARQASECFCGVDLEAGLCPNGHDPVKSTTTPPSTLAKAAAEEIVPDCLSRTCFIRDCHRNHCWGCDDAKKERERVAAIIERCLAGGGESGQSDAS